MMEWLNQPATREWVQGYLIGIVCGVLGSWAIATVHAFTG